MLIHGLGVQDPFNFWRKIPFFLNQDSSLRSDVILYNYDTSFLPQSRILALVKGQSLIANAERIGPPMSNLISRYCSSKTVRNLNIVGHSYGGVVGAYCTEKLAREDTADKRVKLILCASPTISNFWANMIPSNIRSRHLADLSSPHLYKKVYNVILPIVMEKFEVFYQQAINDEAIESIPLLPEGVLSSSHPGRHNWPRYVESNENEPYQTLLSNLVK